MRGMRRITVLLAVVVVAAAVAVGAAGCGGGGSAVASPWVATLLSVSGAEFRPVAINDLGQVVGMVGGRPYRWEKGKMTALPAMLDVEVTEVVALSNAGLIVGDAYDNLNDPDHQAVVWDGDVLEKLPGFDSWVRAVNEHDQIVGGEGGAGGSPATGLVWQNGRVTDRFLVDQLAVDTPDGLSMGGPTDINERGDIVGTRPVLLRVRDDSDYDYEDRAFLRKDRKILYIGTLGGKSWQGGSNSWAKAINERGQIVGASTAKSGNEHAFLWQNGKMIDLGTLGGPSSEAVAINELGHVLGTADTAMKSKDGDTIKHAFLWRNGKMIDLGTLGGPSSQAVAINELGHVLGTAETAKTLTSSSGSTYPAQHAFVWQNGKSIDLGTLPGDTQSFAKAINNQGQIIGTSSDSSGQRHGVLWTKTGS